MTLNTISLKTKDNACPSKDRISFDQLIEGDISYVARIKGGANSQVYLIECDDGRKLTGKIYFQSKHDQRDRGKIEFESLSYLWAKGLRPVPQPIAADYQFHHAVYEYIDGIKIERADVNEGDIHDAVRFLSELKDFSRETDASQFSNASEACFTIKALEGNIQTRIDRLIKVDRQADIHMKLQKFIKNDLNPFFHEAVKWSVEQLNDMGLAYDQEIEKTQLTLSPSDFGFHNALRKNDGSIVFLDFEYFGWDDPAKMICDFILHPAMGINTSLKKQFVDEIFKEFDDYDHLRSRTKVVYPLYGIKWCLIFLNEFIPADLLRRDFASTSTINRDEVLKRQLEKSKRLLSQIQKTYTDNELF